MKKAVIGVALIALLALGCFEGEVTTPEETYPKPTSPVNALKLVTISFNQRKVELLKPELSPDFVFYFDPDDVGQNPPGSEYVIPESWSYTGFWATANNLFGRAYAINLSIPTGGIGTPGPGETRFKAENVSVSLLVMVDERNGYIADNGYCNFAFEVYYNEQKEKRWRLVGWWDFTSAYADRMPGLTPTSLGRILAMYK